MRYLFLCVALLTAGCSRSPTAPTPTSAVPIAERLRWDVMSPGCSATSAPTPAPDFSVARLDQNTDGSVVASWPYSVSGRPVTLYARFVDQGGAFALCSWDTVDT